MQIKLPRCYCLFFLLAAGVHGILFCGMGIFPAKSPHTFPGVIGMKDKRSNTKKEKILTETDIMKYEIAEELGLMDKVKSTGWRSLTARESGKIGGLITKRKRKIQEENRASGRF